MLAIRIEGGQSSLPAALISMGVIVTAVVLRGVAVEPELRGKASHVFSIVRPGVFSAIGVISFAVS